MFIVPSEATVRISTCVPLVAICYGNRNPVEVGGGIDCDLEIAYWEIADDEFDWEVRSVCFDGPNPLYVTPETDKAMWEIIGRGVKADDKYLNEKVCEAIHYDISMGR